MSSSQHGQPPRSPSSTADQSSTPSEESTLSTSVLTSVPAPQHRSLPAVAQPSAPTPTRLPSLSSSRPDMSTSSTTPLDTRVDAVARKEEVMRDAQGNNEVTTNSPERDVAIQHSLDRRSASAPPENSPIFTSTETRCLPGSDPDENTDPQSSPSSAGSNRTVDTTESNGQDQVATEVAHPVPRNSRRCRKRSTIVDDTQLSSENAATQRCTRRTVTRGSAQPTLSSRMLVGEPGEDINAGRKRKFSEMTKETGVVLSDGRRGTFKPSKKHKGDWFYTGGDGAVEKEWMNQDELEEMLQSSYDVVD